jgi:A/G-specific adenine glycosylase
MDGNPSRWLPLSLLARRSLARRLLAWFERAARDLPWRRTRDLYSIWISEVMLQQTQVATVVPYYERFLRQFPSVAALAAADEEQVLRLWEGLGYYRRARQLHAAALQVVAKHGGVFPTAYDDVRGLPGIGRYTAGAILSIGLDARLPILEANSIRVLCRLSGYRGDPRTSAGQKQLWSLAEELLPANRAGAFNQALMELGSEICTPKSPNCLQCPVASCCRAHAEQAQDEIPLPPSKTTYVDVAEAAVVVQRRNQVLLRKCQPGERWAGLWDFPRLAAGLDLIRAVRALTDATIRSPRHLVTLKHGVTRFRITLAVYRAQLVGPPPRGPHLKWCALAELADVPLSVTGRKIARLLNQPATRRTSPSAAVRRERTQRKSR